MNRDVKGLMKAAGATCVILATLWGYRTFGREVARADSAIEKNTGIFYRVIVRRVPFSADLVGDGALFEATLSFKGKREMSRQIFRWDSYTPKIVEIEWIDRYQFNLKFDGTPVHCRHSGWGGTLWGTS